MSTKRVELVNSEFLFNALPTEQELERQQQDHKQELGRIKQKAELEMEKLRHEAQLKLDTAQVSPPPPPPPPQRVSTHSTQHMHVFI